MTAFRWVFGQTESANQDENGVEWDEHWTCIGHAPPLGEPAIFGIWADRPEFREGQPHYNRSVLAKAVNVQVDRLGTVADAWEVVVRYREQVVDQDENPLNQPPEIDLDAESEEVPVLLDADGKPIVNTAGDLIAGITEELNFWVFNVTVKLPSVPRWLLDYRNAVNADAVRISGITIDPGYLLFKRPKAGRLEKVKVGDETISYVPFSFSLVYNPRTWITRVFNRGLYELEWENPDKPGEGKSKKVPIKDDEGEDVKEPQFLDRFGRCPRETVPVLDDDGKPTFDNDGQPITEERIKTTLDPSDIIVIERWTKDRLPFSRLPINSR
jgi:hypothetical protein